MPAQQTTTIGRRWMIKMSVFTLLCAGFAVYALYDATLAYPERARRASSLALFNYLDAATNQGKQYVNIEPFEPRAEMERLRALPSISEQDAHKKVWLEQLAIAGDLDTPETKADAEAVRANPVAAYQALQPAWQQSAGGSARAEALSWYDIPVQWAIFAGCAAITLYLLVLFISVARRRYRWDPDEQRLFLPDGTSLVPDDVEEFDKRRWDKFLIFLKIKEGRGGHHAGKELKLDLYHHHPLEEWVLAMERTAFPETVPPEPAPAPAQ